MSERPRFPAGYIVFLLPFIPIPASMATAEDASSGRGMVIVAPDRFHKALERYEAYRSKQRKTELASLEAILKSTKGADDPEKLKRWLFRRWKDGNVRYVLLVGDADVVPVRFMVLDRVDPKSFDYAFYPSDLYYADVARRDGSFDDWNDAKDGFHAGYFGEVRGEKNKDGPINFDRVDYRPELAVGRWPVDSEAEVRTVAEKTMETDRSARSGHAAGLRRAAFVWVPGWVDARVRMDGWADRLPKGWTAKKLNGDSKAAADQKHVDTLLNDGATLVLHVGHGHDDGWAGSIGVDDLKRLKNAAHLPVIISAGCSTARFSTMPPGEPFEDVHGKKHAGTGNGETLTAPPPPPSPYCRGRYNRTGLGEALVRKGPNGAVAYIGCNTGSQPCALGLLDGFVGALHDLPDPTLGDCWVDAIDHYYEAEHLEAIRPNEDWYPPSIFFQGMKYMVFGDPALRLPAPSK